MEEYQHELYFDARRLTDREKERTRRHFQKKRDSGGGECGMIEEVRGNTYRICFKEKEDQERVLLKKYHTISLPSGDLHLTVSRTASNLDQASTSQKQTFTRANTKTLEKTYPMDVFLLRYLQECPKANKVLTKQLNAIGCTVEINLDEEEAVVRGDVVKGSACAFSTAENWEIQVDRVFINVTDHYLCYHVVEPKQAKLLQQDLSFVSDDIRVYTDSIQSYPVIVGMNVEVKERIEILEKSLPSRKEIQVVEKQFRLVEEEFSRDMRAHFPEVKVQRHPAVIVLEGPEKEVESGATKLDDLMKQVKEKRVQLCTSLLTFIKNSNAISKYQNRFQNSLRNPVSLEVGSVLLLSSLSSSALDEAEAALQRDLITASVQLQGPAAVPPDLDRVKETLLKAKNQANCHEFRVDVSFSPGSSGSPSTTVQLVGYSENVNKLKEVLHEYQVNEVATQELLNLPLPDLVDCFDEVLKMIGFKKTGVTLTPSHFPYPSVLVSGPRRLVQEVQADLNATLASLTMDSLVFDGPGAQQYFRADGKVNKDLVESSCQVVIREQQSSATVKTKPRSTCSPIFSSLNVTSHSSSTASSSSFSSLPHSPSTATSHSSTVNKTSLEIKLGNLLDQQVDVLVAPMAKKQLNSTQIGKCLLSKGGNALKSKFDSAAASYNLGSGDVLQVDAPPSLGFSKIFFIECTPWDGVRGHSVQALSKGLKKCLDLCVQQHLRSVAFPIIGHGILLKYPLREAIQVLTDNILQHGLSASSGSLSTIRIVIKPDSPNSEECYHDVYKQLSSNMNQGGQAIFKSLTSDLQDITMAVGGGVRLRLVFGDITNETTDAVVNTTDFENFYDDGVCKDILTIAGPEVESELKNAKVNRGQVFVSRPGSFPCRAIFHVCGQKDAGLIEQLVCRITEKCESHSLSSVAIPAICAGIGGLVPDVVARAILCGVKTAMSSTVLNCLTDIRLVLIKINVFLSFKKEAMKMFPSAVINTVSAPQIPQIPQIQQPQPATSPPADLSILRNISSSQQSVFKILGLHRSDVDNAIAKLTDLYQAQCSTKTFNKDDLAGLTLQNMNDLKQLVETHGLCVQTDHSSAGSLTVSGLKDGVNQVTQMIYAAVQGHLRREVRVREEEELYIRVAWCILGQNGTWERLPRTANHSLENNDTAGGVEDGQGFRWSVNGQRSEATRGGQTAKLKRLENLQDFPLPLYWDNMAAGENLMKFMLEPSSPEYRAVKEGFKRTAQKTVMKIERLQNVHLRRAYEAQKTRISEKNRLVGGAGELLLYHGTTHDNCNSIMNTGFDRRFAGQNGTAYGHGTYFAVNASYSVDPRYSKPAADGSQLMFVARVLTGAYTQGNGSMTVPPTRVDQTNERYDSVVDVVANPTMYIVFHDNQSYPDYLITFK